LSFHPSASTCNATSPRELSPQELSPRELPSNENDRCAQATIIENPLVESIIPGDTTYVTFQNTVPCGDLPNPRIGLWYQIMNQSSDTINVRASTCTEATNFDTVISVFTGPDCGTLTCVTQKDFSTDGECDVEGASIANFQVLGGSSYWILVDGKREESGTFNLVVSLAPVRGNISLF
jgi:hypothetical protein